MLFEKHPRVSRSGQRRVLPGPVRLRQVAVRRVRALSSTTPPRWGSVRVRLALRTYDAPPWGCIVRVVPDRQTKQEKYPPGIYYGSCPCGGQVRLRLSQRLDAAGLYRQRGTSREPFNSTPMAVNSISSGSPHVRRMGVHRTCGEPEEVKKNTHPEYFTALFRGHR